MTALRFNCRHRYKTGFELDVSFETAKSVTALFGPSGSGKTTILSLIAGLMRPDAGQIEIDGHIVTDTKKRFFVKPEARRVGLLFQDHCLFPHLKVEANIAYGRRRHKNLRVPLDRIVKTLELEDLMDRYPRSLSGGQSQRVALARAIASAPRLLLLDEPLTAVEDDLRDRIAEFIQRVVREFDLPTLLISHNRELVSRLAARVIPIHNGKVGDG